MTFGVDGIREIANLLIFQFRNGMSLILCSYAHYRKLRIILAVTKDGQTYLDRVEFGRGFEMDQNATFRYGEGENLTTVWNGIMIT